MRAKRPGEWLVRFWSAVDAYDGSARDLSTRAGLGPNYISQLRTRQSPPKVDPLLAILDELGAASALYVISGISLDASTARFLQLSSQLESPRLQEAAVRFLTDLLGESEKPAPAPDPRG